MKRLSEFLRIIVFFWRLRLSVDAKKKRRRGNRVHTYTMAREERPLLDLSVGVRVGGGGGIPYNLIILSLFMQADL